MVGASLRERLGGLLAILNGKEIAMQPTSQPGERDRIGRILARQQRAAARVRRSGIFADPDGSLAREVADILADYGSDNRRKVARQ